MKLLDVFICICFLGLFNLVISCEDNSMDNIINTNDEFLIGKWQEKEPEGVGQLGGTNHCIEFTPDNFQLKQVYWTDALTPNDTCNNGYTVFYTGNAIFTETQLTLKGKHANAEFELTNPDCNRDSIFEMTFDYKKEGEDVIILNPNEGVYIQIRLERQ